MRALVQRVTEARVRSGGAVVGEIGAGLCVLVGVTHTDDAVSADKLAEKVWTLRVFADGTSSVPERRAGSVPERRSGSVPERRSGSVPERRTGSVREQRAGVMNRSVADTGGEVLVVSQFTLYADTSRGRRPSWTEAAPPHVAEPLVDAFVEALRARGATVATGKFGADMAVELVNDGPVTIMLETRGA